MIEYSPAEQLAGKDLHDLPSRIPEPTTEQAKCTHKRGRWVTVSAPLGWDEEEERQEWCEESTMVDLPGTHIMHCTQCGYRRRY